MDLIPFSFIYFKICFWCLLDRRVQESKERTTCRRFQTQTQIPAEVFYGRIAPQPGELYCIEVQFKLIPCCVCQHADSVKWLNKKTNKQIWEKGANVQRNTQTSEGRLSAFAQYCKCLLDFHLLSCDPCLDVSVGCVGIFSLPRMTQRANIRTCNNK